MCGLRVAFPDTRKTYGFDAFPSIDRYLKSPLPNFRGTQDERFPGAAEPLWVKGTEDSDIVLYIRYLESLRQLISHELPNSWIWLDFTSSTVALQLDGCHGPDNHEEMPSVLGVLIKELRTSWSLVYRGSSNSHIMLNPTVVISSFVALWNGKESWVAGSFSCAVKRTLTPLSPPCPSGGNHLRRTQPLSTSVLSIWPFQPLDSWL